MTDDEKQKRNKQAQESARGLEISGQVMRFLGIAGVIFLGLYALGSLDHYGRDVSLAETMKAIGRTQGWLFVFGVLYLAGVVFKCASRIVEAIAGLYQ